MKHTFKKGFTLIELLVVISIIALLSTIVLGALQDARAKARDRALASSVMQLQNAIEIYKTNHGTYPGQTVVGPAYIAKEADGDVVDINNILPEITTYIETFPQPTQGVVQYYVDYTTRRCGPNNVTQPYFIAFEPETTALNNWPTQWTTTGGGIWTEVPTRRCVTIQ